MLKLTTALLAVALSAPALAAESGDIALRHLYAGTSSQGIAELDARPDAEARFGKGLLQFTNAIENFGRELYRYGFAPNWGWGGVNFASQLLIPVPANPNPEPLDYEKLRTVLTLLVDEMDEAQKTLREAGVAGDYVIPLDVMKIGLDLDGDGRSAPGESIAAMLGGAMGLANPRRSSPAEPAPLVIGLDRADAIWLAGYTNIVAMQADFLLAHNFHELFDATFHRLFPGAGLPLENDIRGRRARSQGYELLDPDSEVTVADLIALIHTIDWPVVEPDRLKRVRERLLTITALSRQNWAAITAETDNDRELLPNPDQTAAVGRARVSAQQIRAWQSTLDTFDQVVKGELLIPHWRFAKGFDANAYFETATQPDLVMLLSGYDALPFLKDGPIATEASFSAFLRAFGGNWPGYAFWFN